MHSVANHPFRTNAAARMPETSTCVTSKHTASQQSCSTASPSVPFVVFVGAGPVGLWTAVQFKTANPQAPVLMFEKHARYKRSHVLRVEKTSFDEAFAPPGSLLSTFIAQTPSVVRTDELETSLQHLATQLGIEVRRAEPVLSLAALQGRFPSAATVGADEVSPVPKGSRSRCFFRGFD